MRDSATVFAPIGKKHLLSAKYGLMGLWTLAPKRATSPFGPRRDLNPNKKTVQPSQMKRKHLSTSNMALVLFENNEIVLLLTVKYLHIYVEICYVIEM
jgi:hypothetical protein